MTVAYVPGGDRVRVAYAIGRPVGPAVVRNRVRRRLRAAVREIDASPAAVWRPVPTSSGRAPEAVPRSYDDAAHRPRGCA